MGIQSVKRLVALITGGASGLGLATVRRLVRNGASVVLCDLPHSNGQKVADKIGENCIFVPTNVTSEEDVENALSATETKFKKLDVVVNCASVSLLSKAYNFTDQAPHSADSFFKLLNVNTIGTLNVSRLAAGVINKNTPNENGLKGTIINTTSISAFEGSTGHVAFATSCAAIVSMTQTLAQDLLPCGIRCCAVAPGLFDTPYFRSLPKKYQRFLPSLVPFPKGLGNPDEFAHVAQFIIENPYINGEIIRIDGSLRYEL